MNQNTATALVIAGAATFLVAFGTELLTAHSWVEVVSPAFVGKALVQIGGVVAAIYGAKKLKA